MPRKTKTTTTVEDITPASVPVVTNDVVETTTETTDAPDTLSDAFTAVTTKIASMKTDFTAISNEVKALRKRCEREIRTAQKENRKRKNTNRKPSGFVKPTPISSELATFLEKDAGVEMARTEVTREINAYINKHSLKDVKNGRIIHPDAKLRKLLRIKKDDQLTYFNLQRYMKHHFPKTVKATAAEAASD